MSDMTEQRAVEFALANGFNWVDLYGLSRLTYETNMLMKVRSTELTIAGSKIVALVIAAHRAGVLLERSERDE
ncbi:MAG: hypothetical protein PSX71_08680 [bacterium]|nr:hypothetical protein [bacterium]